MLYKSQKIKNMKLKFQQTSHDKSLTVISGSLQAASQAGLSGQIRRGPDS
jgi:hypothetical protein